MISITTTHIQSCFRIKAEGGVGTAFGVKLGDADWMVTAKHNLGGAIVGNSLYLGAGDQWISKPFTEIRPSADQDVAIFRLDDFDVPLPPDGHVENEDPSLGQQLKFLGFPHGLANTYESPLGYSTPLCRNAYLSGAVNYGSRKMLILDGFNNPGYSGAPVWYCGAKASRLYLLGVISGYRVEEKSKSRVYRDEGGGAESVVDSLFVKPNSGMIHAVPYVDLLSLV